jgi:hypothetical protein
VNKFTVGATTALRFELNAYQREKEFYGKVRLALSRVCKPQVPSLGMPALEQQRLYQPRTNFASELVESAEEL